MLTKEETRIAKKKYWAHYTNATRRQISFELTYEEWICIWLNSGHWHQRGNKLNQYCMSRYNDVGPYSVTNVFIQLTAHNTHQANKNKPKTANTRRNMSQAKIGKIKIKSCCIVCKNVISVNNINKHYNSCQRKSPLRGFPSCLY